MLSIVLSHHPRYPSIQFLLFLHILCDIACEQCFSSVTAFAVLLQSVKVVKWCVQDDTEEARSQNPEYSSTLNRIEPFDQDLFKIQGNFSKSQKYPLRHFMQKIMHKVFHAVPYKLDNGINNHLVRHKCSNDCSSFGANESWVSTRKTYLLRQAEKWGWRRVPRQHTVERGSPHGLLSSTFCFAEEWKVSE